MRLHGIRGIGRIPDTEEMLSGRVHVAAVGVGGRCPVQDVESIGRAQPAGGSDGGHQQIITKNVA